MTDLEYLVECYNITGEFIDEEHLAFYREPGSKIAVVNHSEFDSGMKQLYPDAKMAFGCSSLLLRLTDEQLDEVVRNSSRYYTPIPETRKSLTSVMRFANQVIYYHDRPEMEEMMGTPPKPMNWFQKQMISYRLKKAMRKLVKDSDTAEQ